jgi:phage terminase Nu1 subunit (DNA packaging protein)
MTNKAETTPKRRAPGTVKTLATGLNLSRRRTHALLAAGMPEALSEAKKWMKARNTTGGPDSPEALRAERILLVRAQKVRAETENRRLAGELVEAAAAQASATAVCAATRSAMMMLTHSLPPQLVGLSEVKISRVLRTEFVRILSDMSAGRFFGTAEVEAIIAQAKREARG